MVDTPWLADLDAALRAGEWPILEFNTDDWVLDDRGEYPPLRIVEHLAARAARAGGAVVRWSLGGGCEVVAPPGSPSAGVPGLPGSDVPEEALRDLTTMLRSPDPRITLVVDHVEAVCPAAPSPPTREHQLGLEILHSWGLDPIIRAAGNAVILVARQDAPHGLLRSGSCGYRAIRIPLPDAEQRRAALVAISGLGGATDRPVIPAAVEALVAASGGLRIDDLLTSARHASLEGTELRAEALWERKRESIRVLARDLLEVHEPRLGLGDVAGLRHAKRYISSIAGAGSLPAGILLAGPPGTGKSLLAEAIATELSFALVSMRNVREPWVGSSERNLERVLSILTTLAPVVVRLDEVDQIAGQREEGPSGDSGTNRRLLARLWEFMGDLLDDNRILFVGTTNRPDILDAAVRDRFPTVLPLLHPTADEIVQLIPAIAAQLGVRLAPMDLHRIAHHPSLALTTARMIREILNRAALLAAASSPGAPVDGRHIDAAMADHRATLDADRHELLALCAIQAVPFKSDLPWERGGVDAPPYVQKLLDDDGLLDEHLLRARIAALRR